MTTALLRRGREYPVQRGVDGFIVTLHDRFLILRPKRARKPEATVTITYEIIYTRQKIAELQAKLREKERAKKARRHLRRIR